MSDDRVFAGTNEEVSARFVGHDIHYLDRLDGWVIPSREHIAEAIAAFDQESSWRESSTDRDHAALSIRKETGRLRDLGIACDVEAPVGKRSAGVDVHEIDVMESRGTFLV